MEEPPNMQQDHHERARNPQVFDLYHTLYGCANPWMEKPPNMQQDHHERARNPQVFDLYHTLYGCTNHRLDTWF